MMRATVLLGFCAALGAGAAQACDQHGGDYSPMSAYFSYREMSPEQRRNADARSALLARFAIKVERGPDEPLLASAASSQGRGSGSR